MAPPRLGERQKLASSSVDSFTGVRSVYDTAPWRAEAEASLVEKKNEKNMKSKSRQQLDKLQEGLKHLKHQQQNQNRITNKRRTEQFLSTKQSITTKPLFTSDVAQLVDYEGFHPNKEEKLKRRDEKRIVADTKSDWFDSPFKGLFSRMPSFGDFLLANVEELARTPRHSSPDLNYPTENPRAAWQIATETSLRLGPSWSTALATLSPDQVRRVQDAVRARLSGSDRLHLQDFN